MDSTVGKYTRYQFKRGGMEITTWGTVTIADREEAVRKMLEGIRQLIELQEKKRHASPQESQNEV